jgi:hypothetical protein
MGVNFLETRRPRRQQLSRMLTLSLGDLTYNVAVEINAASAFDDR